MNHLFGQIIECEGIAEIPEAAVTDLQDPPVAMQVTVGEREGFRAGIADLELKPDAGDEPMLADHLAGRGEAVGKGLAVDDPVAVLLATAAWSLGPAVVDDEILRGSSLQTLGKCQQIFLSRIAPAGAPLVHHDGQLVFDLRQICKRAFLCGTKSLGELIDVALDTADRGDGRIVGFASLQCFEPMPELAVGLTAGERDEIIPAEHLHLPRTGSGELRAPENTGLAILERNEGEKSTHRHGACLAKAFAGDAVTDPGTLELQILDGLRVEAPFGTPSGAVAMHQQSIRRVVMSIRRHATERKAAEHFEGDRFFARVAHPDRAVENRFVANPGKLMFATQSRGVFERGNYSGDAVFFGHLLGRENQIRSGVARSHGATLRKRTGVFVFEAFELNQGIQRKRRNWLPARGKPADLDIGRE